MGTEEKKTGGVPKRGEGIAIEWEVHIVHPQRRKRKAGALKEEPKSGDLSEEKKIRILAGGDDLARIAGGDHVRRCQDMDRDEAYREGVPVRRRRVMKQRRGRGRQIRG